MPGSNSDEEDINFRDWSQDEANENRSKIAKPSVSAAPPSPTDSAKHDLCSSSSSVAPHLPKLFPNYPVPRRHPTPMRHS